MEISWEIFLISLNASCFQMRKLMEMLSGWRWSWMILLGMLAFDFPTKLEISPALNPHRKLLFRRFIVKRMLSCTYDEKFMKIDFFCEVKVLRRWEKKSLRQQIPFPGGKLCSQFDFPQVQLHPFWFVGWVHCTMKKARKKHHKLISLFMYLNLICRSELFDWIIFSARGETLAFVEKHESH